MKARNFFPAAPRLILMCAVFVAFASHSALAQNRDRRALTEQAYEAYQQGKYQEALELYQRAGLDIPETAGLEFNKGAAHSKLGDLQQALKRFEKATLTENPELASAAHFNQGNTYYQQQDFQHAVEQYKSSLRGNPADPNARYNLELALKKLREQQRQEQENQQEGDQEQEDKDQEKSQDKQEPQESQDKKDQKQQDSETKQTPDSSQSRPEQKPQKFNPYQMSKEDAERLLNALKDEELKHQKNKRIISTSVYHGKDW
ncbi:MAG: tetratricopeptide repeat protein [Candidatus Zixiibacteriota bacterium]